MGVPLITKILKSTISSLIGINTDAGDKVVRISVGDLIQQVDAGSSIGPRVGALESSTVTIQGTISPIPAQIAALQSGQLGGLVSFADVTAMNATLTYNAGAVAVVSSTGAMYQKLGASGAGSWTAMANGWIPGAQDYTAKALTYNRVLASNQGGQSVSSGLFASTGGSFFGMGQTYVEWAGMSFNAVRVPLVQRPPGNEANRWLSAHAEVRNTNQAGALLASGTVLLNRYADWQGGLVVPLDIAVTEATVTDGGGNFFVGIYFKDATGAVSQISAFRVATGGSVPHRGSLTFYYSGGGGWTAYSGNPLAAFDLVSLTGTVKAESNFIYRVPRFTNNYPDALFLPPIIYGLAGHEMNVYHSNCAVDRCLHTIPHIKLNTTIPPAQGKFQQDRFVLKDTIARNFTLTMSLKDPLTGTEIAKKDAGVRISAANAAAGKSIKILLCGDSIILKNNKIAETISALSSADLLNAGGGLNITLLGTKGSGAFQHEGITGWGPQLFYSNAGSPFVFTGVFNFGAYMAANGFSGVDYVVFIMGANSVTSSGMETVEHARGIAGSDAMNYEAMIANIKAYDPTIRVAICPSSPGSFSQDAFGVSYGADDVDTPFVTADQYHRKLLAYGDALSGFISGREAAGIDFMWPGLNLDTRNNMEVAAGVINDWNSTTVSRQNDGAHPANIGLQQNGDPIFAYLKYWET